MAPLTDIALRVRDFGLCGQLSPSGEPISRTMQYRKITKPLLERQRRARINRSLDELKEILIVGLQSEGENVARLEKADILELTVRHLNRLQQQVSSPSAVAPTVAVPVPFETACIHNLGSDEKFRRGFSTCAKEVSRVLASTPKIDIQLGTSLMVHLGNSLNQLSTASQQRAAPMTGMTESALSPSLSEASASSLESYRPYTPPLSPDDDEEMMDTTQSVAAAPPMSIDRHMSPKSLILARAGYKKHWRPW